jgi:Zn-finger nucleic acid-binding protein
MTDRQGIEIDYCPTCRGVWLDRGELDKIIERSTSQRGPEHPSPQHQLTYRKPKRKESWLSELFD